MLKHKTIAAVIKGRNWFQCTRLNIIFIRTETSHIQLHRGFVDCIEQQSEVIAFTFDIHTAHRTYILLYPIDILIGEGIICTTCTMQDGCPLIKVITIHLPNGYTVTITIRIGSLTLVHIVGAYEDTSLFGYTYTPWLITLAR